MTFQIPRGGTVTGAASGRDWLRFDRDFGVSYTSGEAQGDAIQDAIDAAAGDGRSLLLAGNLISDVALTFHGEAPVWGVGSADNPSYAPSSISFTGDLDGAVPAIDFESAGVPHRGGNYAVFGPATYTTYAVGTSPTLVDGLACRTKVELNDMRIRGFRSGMQIFNDHHVMRQIDLQSNAIGLDFANSPPGSGLGDLLFDRLILTTNSMASVGISHDATMSGAQFIGGHCGFSPFGIWRYPHFYAATGSNASAVITGVTFDYTPVMGNVVAGPEIPNGTTITNVAGTTGNWTLTLSATPTGPVTKVIYSTRTTCVRGVLANFYSWEYCSEAEIYDQVWKVYGIVGGIDAISYNGTQSSSTFTAAGFTNWTQGPIAATGSNGNKTLTGVALTTFPPMEGLAVAGTNVPAGAYITSWSGTSGSYTVKLSAAATGAVSSVTVSQPTDLGAIDGSEVSNLHWIDGVSPTLQPARHLIKAKTIFGVTIDQGGPVQDEPFKITQAGSQHALYISDVRYGDSFRAYQANQALAAFDVLERDSYVGVKPWAGTAESQFAGVTARAWSQWDAAVVGVAGTVTVRVDAGGSTITAGKLVKPDPTNDGCVVEASSPTDGLVLGKLIETITAGDDGPCRLTAVPAK